MRRRESGFALPLAAAAIALLAVALSVAADAMAGWRAAERREEARWRLELAAATLEGRVAHIALTTPLAPRAFETRDRPLLLDGRPYVARVEGAGDFILSVHDEAGLFNVNVQDEQAIGRLLRSGGVAAWQAERLAGALADLTDEDDLRRLNGAETAEYTSSGRAQPPNAPLSQAGDAWRAFGWDALDRRTSRHLLALVSAGDPARPFNPNTAPPQVLVATFGLDARGVAALINARETRVIVSGADVAEISGATLPEGMDVTAQPARDFRLEISRRAGAPQESSIYVVQLRRAEAGEDAPFTARRFSTGARDWERQQGNGRLDWLPDSPALPPARKR